MFRPNRRQVLAMPLPGVVAALTGNALATAQTRTIEGAGTPFTVGVSSGQPTATGVVLWTRLAPTPLAEDGSGGLYDSVPVRWEIGLDPALRRVVRQGVAIADGRFAHSVHVEVEGLTPDRPYWYRFTALGHQSRIGRTRTAPAPGASLGRLRVGFVSCAHWELGYFSAYRHLAEEAPDLILYLGDYIYEYSYRASDLGSRIVRQHDRSEDTDNLVAYRNRYALYHSDPDLQALMASAPCLATWDDHEVQNDYANRWSQDVRIPPDQFLRRRAAGYRAFYEHMPLRRSSLPNGPDMRVYGSSAWGALADLSMLDGRQYRSIQACPIPSSRRGHVAPLSCPEFSDETRTMLGLQQEAWLYQRFRDARARWTIVAQDLLIAPILQSGRDGTIGHYTDGWDGYAANRARMLASLSTSGARNPVFLGGDIHSFWATDLKTDFQSASAPVIATEFVGAAISQEPPARSGLADHLAENPHVRFCDVEHNGYGIIDVTPGQMAVRFRAISDRKDRNATVSTLRSFVVEDGRAGVQLA